MAPIIHLVRHAQGEHNQGIEYLKIPDPFLTDLGDLQCRNLRQHFPDHDKITFLVASPMRRTLYTCMNAFGPVVDRGIKMIALPDAQEISALPCDIGSDLSMLKDEWLPKVHLHLVQEGWNDKSPGSKYYPSPENLMARAQRVRLWLRDLVKDAGGDMQVVLVTHDGFLHFLTEDWDGIVLNKGTGWENTELRSYEFEDQMCQDPNATLKETQESWRRRRGTAISLTETEQVELREAFQTKLAEEVKKHAAVQEAEKAERED